MKNKTKLLITTALALSLLLTALPSAINSNPNNMPDLSRAYELYKKHCSKCHRNNGSGIKTIYPPLRNSDYIINGTTDELLRGMLFGRSGKIVVNGETYNGVMTTEIDASLTDEDIASILTYVYIKLNDRQIVATAKDVQVARKKGKLPPHK